jgi:membrane fusion protein (multidrug efflux system)
MWGAWLFWSELTVYVATSQARIEAYELVHPVVPQVGGRVVRARLIVGELVAKGDVLLEIDKSIQTLQLEELRASVAASVNELQEMRRLVEAEEKVIGQMGKAAQAALAETNARVAQAEVAAVFAESKADRMNYLKNGGHLPELDILGAQAEAEQQRAMAKGQRLAYQRLVADQGIQTSDRLLRIEQLRQQMIRLEGQIRSGEANIKLLEAEIEQRTVRAPVGGRIGESSEVTPGAIVSMGQQVAAIVPPGDLKIVAMFPAYDAVGRLAKGQRARLRLNAFPWTQYGSVIGEVTRVASEPRDGMVRVEIRIDERSSRLIPYQHGLIGTVEVAVEEVSPAVLLLRAAGRLRGRAAGATEQGSTAGTTR